MLHSTREVTLSREDFKAEAEQINNIYKKGSKLTLARGKLKSPRASYF